MRIKIAPSILAADLSRLGDEVRKVEMAGADMIHVDVMDGHFVPNITLGPVVVRSLAKSTKLPIEAHLMIENPEKYIESFAKAGASIINIHVEASKDLDRDIKLIRSFSVKPGIVFNPGTPLKRAQAAIEKVEMVMIMSVNPGFEGQKFMPEVLPKISELRKIIEGKKLNIDIAVDGGINLITGKQAVDAGANLLIAASAIFWSKDYREMISGLKALG